ncbi:MAG: MBL fold metallo-hydrolase [Spirochaetaceae bacterium]|jgi:7,8-dihydropterin-6-yl-methyl-4-(beta-D-ribofuranosyl)aminobenzene 5'-phosphate synthase|nr:MBL fold metallo-hydrolase [Spirochaetaceae bacterium]
MKVTVLVENGIKESTEGNLKTKHGLSLYIENKNQKILFDVGPNKLFAQNAKKLKIDLADVDYAVISHAHYDHGGGLKHFLSINSKAKIILHGSSLNGFYNKVLGFIPFYIGLDRKLIKNNIKRFQFLDEDLILPEGLSVLVNMPNNFPRPPSNKSLYKKFGKKMVRDDFDHEIILLVKEDNGTVLFSGCSHSGVLNIIGKSTRRLGKEKLKAFIGGLHLKNPKNEKDIDEIEQLSFRLNQIDTNYYTGHCTGVETISHLRSHCGERINGMNTGDVLII